MQKFKHVLAFIQSLYPGLKSIPLHAPVFNGNEKKYLTECIESKFVSSIGRFVDQFEKKIAEFTGAKKAVVCVNGTNALHLALLLSGVENNTEVITQPLTFIATANAISYCGAKPIFLDVDRSTLGLSPKSLEQWLEQNIEFRNERDIQISNDINNQQFSNIHIRSTKLPRPFNKTTNRRISAVLPMHTFGHPAKIEEIVRISSKYNLPVVEDAAESLGSYYVGKHTGTFGKIGILSFNGNKILTTGGGGMLLFMDDELARIAKHITTQAKTSHPWEFFHDQIGYNYRMPNINAALGLAQLEQLPLFLKNKRETASAYKSFFEKTDFEFFTEPKGATSNYWLNCIFLNSRVERDDFLQFMNDNKVMARPAWCLLNKLPMFHNCQSDNLDNAKWCVDRLVNIPSSVRINEK
jgi:dTDP-4-amino-4,6-dideoxygalactose transaminase